MNFNDELRVHRAAGGRRTAASCQQGRAVVPAPPQSQVTFLLVALFVLVIMTQISCATTWSLEPLEVNLVSLEFTEATLFETTVVADLRVANPNPDSLSLEGASFKLYLEGKKVGTGMTDEIFTVERLSDHVFTVTFRINNASAILRLTEIVKQESVEYGLRGAFFTQGALGTKKLKFERSGTFDLKAQPKIKPGDDSLGEHITNE
jgi:LEA14-like dessication related protein